MGMSIVEGEAPALPTTSENYRQHAEHFIRPTLQYFGERGRLIRTLFLQWFFLSDVAVRHDMEFVATASAERLELEMLRLSYRFTYNNVTRI